MLTPLKRHKILSTDIILKINEFIGRIRINLLEQHPKSLFYINFDEFNRVYNPEITSDLSLQTKCKYSEKKIIKPDKNEYFIKIIANQIGFEFSEEGFIKI